MAKKRARISRRPVEGEESGTPGPSVKKVATKKTATKKKTVKKTVKKAAPASQEAAAPKPSPIIVATCVPRAPTGEGFSYETKKRLTKKQQAQATNTHRQLAKGNAKTSSGLLSGFRAAALKKFGADAVYSNKADRDKLVIGIPIPALAFELLFGNDVIPLNSVLQIAGLFGTCKSSLGFELMRWFVDQYGVALHVDAENKYDPDLAMSILGRTGDPDFAQMITVKAENMDAAQSSILSFIDMQKKEMDGTADKVGPGRVIPHIMCLDSWAMQQKEEDQLKTLKAGTAGRGFAIGALSNKGFLQTLVPAMQAYPFTFLAINHMKVKQENGITKKTTLGGDMLNFAEAVEIFTSRWKKSIECSQFMGIGIGLEIGKNSYGEGGRKLKTRFIWWHETDPITGDAVKRHAWDWNWSLMQYLNDLTGYYKGRLTDAGVRVTLKQAMGTLEATANCSALGMGKSDYAPICEVGAAIQADTDLCNKIRSALGVSRRRNLDLPMNLLHEQYRNEAD